MKHLKKLASFLLVLVMVLSVTTTAFAEEGGETTTNGSITITNALKGETYNAYQILYLESYDAENNIYAYKANSAWEAWLKTQKKYVAVNPQGYVTC